MIRKAPLPSALVLLATIAAPPAAVARERPFSFWQAEFMPQDRAMTEAQAFVASALRPGLAMTQARARLRRAGMVCGRPQGPDDGVECVTSETVHIGGGLIGEDRWTVRLTPDGRGGLRAARLGHEIIGSGPPNP